MHPHDPQVASQERTTSLEGRISDLSDELTTLQSHYDEQASANDDLRAQLQEAKSAMAEAERDADKT